MDGKTAKILVFILNWNGAEHTKNCLRSLAKCSYPNKEVIVLDNASSDSSLSTLKELERTLPFLTIRSVPQNLGFAGGINFLLEQYQHLQWDYLLLLNNDAELTTETLPSLMKLNNQLGTLSILGASTVNKHGIRTFIGQRWPALLFGLKKGFHFNKTLQAWPTDYVEGSGLFIAKKLVERRLSETGYFFRKDLFLYCEDLDLGVWAKQNHIPMWISLPATILHHGSASGGGTGNPNAYYYMTRNRLLVAHDLLPPFQWALFLTWTLATRPALLVKHLLQGRRENVKAVLQGLKDFFAKRTQSRR